MVELQKLHRPEKRFPTPPTYQEVKEAFLEFRLPSQRGGYPTPHTPYYNESNSTAPITKDYHTERSYTDEQAQFIRATMTRLSGLVVGTLYPNTDDSPPLLSERIIHIYNRLAHASNHESQRFTDATVDAVSGLLREFHKRYPYLDRALQVLMNLAGAEGLATAVHFPLKHPTDDDTPLHKNREIFVQQHPKQKRKQDAFQYEVWCSGEAMAKKIIDERIKAAGSLGIPLPLNDPFDFKQTAQSKKLFLEQVNVYTMMTAFDSIQNKRQL